MVEPEVTAKCPACRTPLSQEGPSAGLCLGCLLEMALEDSALEAKLFLEPEAAPDLRFSAEGLAEGEIHGDRYRVRSLLGRGGFGEVWRAYDLKLRQDVALKTLRAELIRDKRTLEILRQEVRTAREVVSPNVCRVYDLEELDGRELVSMEYVDGTTLQEILKERGPLELNEAREIASQFLAGLEAIHEAGLVHRDIKPENVMITRTGRVVVMDFGIAKGLGDDKRDMVAGTQAFMSPEQGKGHELDPRADLFSAGVVLAEMVGPGGMRSFEDRKRVWEGLRQEIPQVSETAWTKVILKAVAPNREDRFPSAEALALALEEVTLRATGDETARPYPGLSAFQREDAEFFYGRELEVEALWKKLRRPHLFAVIGPSGAGKSSFLRAGLLPTLTDRWQAAITTPSNRPFANLARALAEKLSADPITVDALLRFEEPETAVELIFRWREEYRHGLIILDQFEELFTQNPEETQRAFARLLGRLPLEADVHVLLAMRDDFLYHCHRYGALQPILSDLTLLGPPTGASLRRAIVQPALKCGYRFEDEAIVEGMLGEVEGERGSLSMVAFAAETLWDRRDRNRGLLTCEAYEEIGGVGGALAQHAESTLEEIGDDRIPIARELLRNLVTAEGTKAARDRGELLSVFGDRSEAESVLNALIDARLLTSYEVEVSEADKPHHHIEIIHESLLANWPRLVRWRMQDAEGAKLRDELRSQARLWEEHGRSEDYLWTGTAFKEYELWRELYPGGLSETEEAFAHAMTSLAVRRKRRRRIVVATVITALVISLTTVAGFWHRAEQERLRAEAGQLIALGELQIEGYPTATLAWATKSLEVFDTHEGRILALRALQKAPPATVLPGSEDSPASGLFFSSSGERLAIKGWDRGVSVLSQDGKEAVKLVSYPDAEGWPRVAFPSEDLIVVETDGEVRWFSVPERRGLRRVEGGRGHLHSPSVDGYYSFSVDEGMATIHWWPYSEGDSKLVGSMPAWGEAGDIDSNGSWMVYNRGSTVFSRSLENWTQTPRKIGQHMAEVLELSFHPAGDRVAARDAEGELRVWSLNGSPTQPLRTLEMVDTRGVVIRSQVGFGGDARWLGFRGMEQGVASVRLWDLEAPVAAQPLLLRKSDESYSHGVALHPSGRLVVSAYLGDTAFWPLPRQSRWLFQRFGDSAGDLRFSPDGRWVILTAGDGLRAWPLEGQNEGKVRILVDQPLRAFGQLAFDPTGEYVAVGGLTEVLIVPIEGGPAREMPAVWSERGSFGMAIDFNRDGRLLAAAPMVGPAEDMVIRVWDLETDEIQVLGPVPGSTSILSFEDDRWLRWVGWGGSQEESTGGERVFDLEDGGVEILTEEGWIANRATSSSGDFLLESELLGTQSNKDLATRLTWRNLEDTETRLITTHPYATTLYLHPSDLWFVSGGQDGILRVGAVSGEEPHLLFGHTGLIRSVAVSPDGHRIASVGDDWTVRIWPFPDMSKPPLHTLPRDALIAELQSRTNVRVVASPQSPTGWKLDYAPFPGWSEIPEWP